jgi:hypothetical protein
MIFYIKMPSQERPQPTDVAPQSGMAALTSIWQEWLAGFQVVGRDRLLVAIFTVMAIAMFGQGILSVTWFIFVREKLAGGPFEYGIVQVAVATGGIAGAFLLERIGRTWMPANLIIYSGMLTGILLFSSIRLPYLPLILTLQFFAGIAAVGFFVTMSTVLQSHTSDHYLGRVFGAFHTTSALLLLCGQGLAASLSIYVGNVLLLYGAATFYFLSGVIALFLLHKVAIVVGTVAE